MSYNYRDYIYAVPLEVNCTTDQDMLTVMVTCDASNPVSEVICSYDGGPTVQCKTLSRF